jgi:aspartate aminotransferase
MQVNLGIGAYRDDNGKPWVLPAVKKAERMIVDNAAMDHEYLSIEGLQSFTDASARFILGKDSPVVQDKRVSQRIKIHGLIT